MKRSYLFAAIAILFWSTVATVSKLLLGQLDRQRQKQLLRQNSAVGLHVPKQLLKENALVCRVLIDQKNAVALLDEQIGMEHLSDEAPGLFLDRNTRDRRTR